MKAQSGVRKLIFNADDFGYSSGINTGIIAALDGGLVKSTSVMVNRVAASQARDLAKRHNISLGLHLDMTEEGFSRWQGVASMAFWSIEKVQAEFDAQITKFKKITGRLPDHIDSHHHIHRILPNWRQVTTQFSRHHQIPVRSVDAQLVLGFFGRSMFNWHDLAKVSPTALISLIAGLPAGTYEIMTHPGHIDPEMQKHGSYLAQREVELETLTSQEVKFYISTDPTIQLINWNDIRPKVLNCSSSRNPFPVGL